MRKVSENHPTKERILQIAERLFAEKGLDGSSMRDITDAAGVNLASVNYHFGSKDGLIAAVFHRHIAPLNEARINMLDAVEKAAGNHPPTIEAVLEAFIRPAVAYDFAPNSDRDVSMRLMGRCLIEPAAYSEKHIQPLFQTLIQRFTAAAALAEPNLQADEIFWRMTFMAGALHYALHKWSRMDKGFFKPKKPVDAEELVNRLVSFAATGWRAQVPELDQAKIYASNRAFEKSSSECTSP
jgi:AcrR family transcriptional regulator